MIAIYHNHHWSQNFLDGLDVGFPHISANGVDSTLQSNRHTRQKGFDGFFVAGGQHRQHFHLTMLELSRDNDHIIITSFFQSDLIQPNHFQPVKRTPINLDGHITIDYPDHRFIAQIFFDGHILNGAIDQLQQDLLLIGFGMATFGMIPG